MFNRPPDILTLHICRSKRFTLKIETLYSRKEEYFTRAYEQELIGPHLQSKRKSHVRGIVFGFAQVMNDYDVEIL